MRNYELLPVALENAPTGNQLAPDDAAALPLATRQDAEPGSQLKGLPHNYAPITQMAEQIALPIRPFRLSLSPVEVF